MTRGDLTALAGVDFTHRFATIAEAVRGLTCDSAPPEFWREVQHPPPI
jgi:hypothetical protein